MPFQPDPDAPQSFEQPTTDTETIIEVPDMPEHTEGTDDKQSDDDKQ